MNLLQMMKNLLFCVVALAFPATVIGQVAETTIGQEREAGDKNDPSKPLPADIVVEFKSIHSDPDPEKLVQNAHYWVSNENAHYVWYPHIQNLGGILSGVGTDQIYLLATWSRPAILVPLDFDRQVRDLHFAYGAAFLESEDINSFLSFWKKEGSDKMKASLEKHFPDKEKAAMIAYKTARSTVAGRLSRVSKKYKKLEIPTFLTDETHYQIARELWVNQRVYPICGDLTADNAMLELAQASQKSGIKLSVLYLSNAEHYFTYTPSYRRNIIAQNYADNAIILRTRQMKSLGLAEEGDYHYNTQSAENFKIWLETSAVNDQHKMLRKRSKTTTEGLSVLDFIPEASAKKPTIAPIP